MKRRRRVKKLGRFRLDWYCTGECDHWNKNLLRFAEDRASYAAAHFESASDAVASFLASNWDWTTEPDIPEPDKIPETLLGNTALVVDREKRCVAAVIAFRWPELGESRLPVAMITTLPGGAIRLETIEQHQAAQKAA